MNILVLYIAVALNVLAFVLAIVSVTQHNGCFVYAISPPRNTFSIDYPPTSLNPAIFLLVADFVVFLFLFYFIRYFKLYKQAIKLKSSQYSLVCAASTTPFFFASMSITTGVYSWVLSLLIIPIFQMCGYKIVYNRYNVIFDLKQYQEQTLQYMRDRARGITPKDETGDPVNLEDLIELEFSHSNHMDSVHRERHINILMQMDEKLTREQLKGLTTYPKDKKEKRDAGMNYWYTNLIHSNTVYNKFAAEYRILIQAAIEKIEKSPEYIPHKPTSVFFGCINVFYVLLAAFLVFFFTSYALSNSWPSRHVAVVTITYVYVIAEFVALSTALFYPRATKYMEYATLVARPLFYGVVSILMFSSDKNCGRCVYA